jgi:uncharacterized protein
MNYIKIESFVLEKLKANLSPTLHYHGFPHTMDVIANVILIAENEGITTDELFLLKLAALFHDLGFLEAYSGHEEIGCKMAKEMLPGYGVTETEINLICGMIMATKIPQKPKTKLEQILCDADLLYLGTDDFIKIGNTLYEELKENGKLTTINEWNEIQVPFLQKHHFHTNFVVKNFSKKKAQNLRKIIQLLKDNP